MAAIQKRKRETQDMGTARAAPAMNQQSNDFEQYQLPDDSGLDSTIDFSTMVNNSGDANETGETQNEEAQGGEANNTASDTAAAAMAQYHTMTVPPSTAQTFMSQPTAGEGQDEAAPEQSGSSAQQRTSSFGDNAAAPASPNGEGSASPENSYRKPAVGTEEWHKVRKENHKEVERRRRETINEGINELAKIVPGCEKNKGSILQRAVQFITQLKENESQNIEKWTLEKLLTEQAIAELSSSCDKLKHECERAWAEVEHVRKAAKKAGLSLKRDAKDDADGEEAD